MTTEHSARRYVDWARQLKWDVGRCELCGHTHPGESIPWERQTLEVHHVADGVDKGQARMDRRFALCLFYRCHDEMRSTVPCPACVAPDGTAMVPHGGVCHLCGTSRVVPKWNVASQLALIRIRRPLDFNDAALELWNTIVTGANRVTADEIAAAERIVRERIG